MPKIPDASALGATPSGRSGRPIATVDVGSVARAVEDFGRTAQVVVQDLAAEREKSNAYEAERKMTDFLYNEEASYNDAAANVQPGAAGFAAGYSDGFRKRAKAFADANFGGLSKESRRELDHRLFTAERKVFLDAATTERTERSRYGKASLASTIDNSVLPRAGLAKTPEDFESIVSDANRTIDANPTLSPVEKDEEKLKTRQRLEVAMLAGKTPQEQQDLLNGGSVADRIIGVESGGDEAAKNPNSSALGPGQFIDSTWLDVVSRYRPDLVKGRTRDEILALRTDQDISREMVNRFAAENGRYLSANGIPATPGNIYLAHFAGPEGAVKLLTADPNASAASILGQKAVDANKSILAGKTAADVVAWADGKMAGSKGSSVIKAMPYEDRLKLVAGVDEEVRKDRVNTLMTDINDGVAGEPEIEAARKAGWLTDAGEIEKAKKAADDVRVAADTSARLQNPNYVFSPFDADEVKGINKLYERGPTPNGEGLLEGDAGAVQGLEGIVSRTEIIPDKAKDRLRSGIWSKAGAERDNAFQVVEMLRRRAPAAVARAFSEEDIKRIQDYEQLAPLLPPEELNQRLDPAMNPQEAKRREDLRKEGLKVAAEYDNSKITDAFDPGLLNGYNMPWPNEPLLPSDPIGLTALRTDFDALFAERYAVTGQKQIAFDQAVERLREKWGTSSTSSDGAMLTAYPPEQYYSKVNGSHAWMADQLKEFVSTNEPGAQSWSVIPVPGTEAAVAASKALGRPLNIPYAVRVMDKNGAFKILTKAGSLAPMEVVFDHPKARDAAREDFESKRTGGEPFLGIAPGNLGAGMQ